MKGFQTKLLVLFIAFGFGIISAADTIAIIDAGSSGSRLYVFEIDKNDTAIKTLHSEKKNTALSETNGVNAIDSLLKNPEVGYVKSQKVPLYVLATAGMRMLDSNSANGIYGKVTKHMKDNGYELKAAKTISGRYEGLYAWIAAVIKNGVKDDNFGIIEIGGASMQQTFPSDSGNIERFGMSIYSRSYLGWGANEVDSVTYMTKRAYQTTKPVLQKGTGITWYKLGGGFLAFGGNYGNWLLDGTAAKNPTTKSEWTEGAAIDIIINKETPEGFNYSNPN